MFVDVEEYPDVDVSSIKGILSPSLPWKCFTHERSENTRPETRKREHYTDLSQSYFFAPVASETLGAWAPSSLKFISDLGQRIRIISGQHNSSFFLFQSLGVEIQRGNAASVIGTSGSTESLEEVFYL